MREKLIKFFEDNNYNSIKDTGMTWQELAEHLEFSSGESARKCWFRAKRSFGKNFDQFCKERNINPDNVTSAQYIGKKDYFNLHMKFANSSLTKSDIKEFIESIEIKQRTRKQPKFVESEDYLVINMSDQHIGMDSKDSLYNMKWNIETYYKRLDKVIDYLEETFDDDFKEVHVNFLGDMTDGFDGKTTRGGHNLPQNLTNKEMYTHAVESTIYFIEKLMSIYRCPITVHMVTNSNHGGILDYTAAHTVKRIFKDIIPVQTIDGFSGYYFCGKRSILLTHGYDESHMSKGKSMPYFLNSDWISKIRTLKDYYKLDETILIRGDKHKFLSVDYEHFHDIMVPSMSTPSNWIQHNFHSTYKGGFVVLILSNDVLETYKVDF